MSNMTHKKNQFVVSKAFNKSLQILVTFLNYDL